MNTTLERVRNRWFKETEVNVVNVWSSISLLPKLHSFRKRLHRKGIKSPNIPSSFLTAASKWWNPSHNPVHETQVVISICWIQVMQQFHELDLPPPHIFPTPNVTRNLSVFKNVIHDIAFCHFILAPQNCSAWHCSSDVNFNRLLIYFDLPVTYLYKAQTISNKPWILKSLRIYSCAELLPIMCRLLSRV